ncbi:hypothetical protein [Vagococcus fluvialis]|uniref:hypothetical protein n=1 Tax=Vagococcus fluvialis TaxID=2738 RepID=UPI0037B46AD7
MRIDDENKVVWCSESEMEWYVSCNYGNPKSLASDMNRIKCLATEKEPIVLFMMSQTAKFLFIKAIANNYEFKLEQPQKYYWRKKKEHLAWFEKQENCYLSKDFIGRIKLSNLDDEGAYKYFKFTEDFAHDLLKDDFDKFEKVECE